MSPPARGRSWIFQVTALCIVLGMLLALSLKTQRQAVSEGSQGRWPTLLKEFRNLKQENEKLENDLADVSARYQELMGKQARGMGGAENVEESLAEARLLAGTVAVRGQGVVVTLRDSPKRDPAETRQDIIENYMVHDYDIRAITNELFASGAEAISVNGQRIVANSSIRCVGPVVLVNSRQIAPPYVVKAIGTPDLLQKALELPGGVADGLFLLDMIEVKKHPDVVVPAYTGSTRFSVGRPMPEEKGR